MCKLSMTNGQTKAYIIMESVVEPSKPRNVKSFNDELFYVNFDTYLQSFGCKNRNKRIYEGDAVMASLNQPHIRELLTKRALCGEAGHPLTNDTTRILTIDPKLICFRINNFERRGNLLHANVETLDTNMGKDMTKYILQGGEPSFSLRALASLTDVNGTKVMKSRAHVVTYDWVILPSHCEAYRDETSHIKAVRQKITDNKNVVCESSVFAVNESQILSYIKAESKNVNFISNICEVALESMTISEDLKSAIVKEGNEKYVINLESYITKDIKSYLRGL